MSRKRENIERNISRATRTTRAIDPTTCSSATVDIINKLKKLHFHVNIQENYLLINTLFVIFSKQIQSPRFATESTQCEFVRFLPLKQQKGPQLTPEKVSDLTRPKTIWQNGCGSLCVTRRTDGPDERALSYRVKRAEATSLCNTEPSVCVNVTCRFFV